MRQGIVDRQIDIEIDIDVMAKSHLKYQKVNIGLGGYSHMTRLKS